MDRKICTVDGCESVLKAKKMCMKHYMQARRDASEGFTPTPWNQKPPPEDRFWQQVDKSSDPDECWVWLGRFRKKKGQRTYGVVWDGTASVPAHRYSYHIATGEELSSAVPIHHKCSNTLCVNPNHLQATTWQENTAEMLERLAYQRRIAELEARLAACTCG